MAFKERPRRLLALISFFPVHFFRSYTLAMTSLSWFSLVFAHRGNWPLTRPTLCGPAWKGTGEHLLAARGKEWIYELGPSKNGLVDCLPSSALLFVNVFPFLHFPWLLPIGTSGHSHGPLFVDLIAKAQASSGLLQEAKSGFVN